ncbi:MAG: hypothetical protein Udaeo2_10530 [Candidatus Udaeobacter sp.]|nr:MAG: hypothetical protein Udaeo2_10530 [Candidatus Udaeobacter sp.]
MVRSGNGAAGKIDFLLWKAIKCRFGRLKFFARSGVAHAQSIGDTKCAELREIAVVKDQNEMGRLVAETLEHMGMATWKVPDSPGSKSFVSV